jgi:hypothetical protein
MMTAVSPRVSERLSVVMVRVTLHEVSPNAMAIAVAIANRQCYGYPQSPSATLVERRDIPLWGMFDDAKKMPTMTEHCGRKKI